MRLVVWLLVNALALLVAIWLFQGITLHAATRTDQAVQLVATGAVFGAINFLVKPVVKLVSLPFIILSLGLVLLVINALMLLLTSHIASSLGIGFHVDGFGTAVLGAIVISVAGVVIEAALPDGR